MVNRGSVTATVNGEFFGDGIHYSCRGKVLRALEAFLPLLLQLIVQQDFAIIVDEVLGSKEDGILNGAHQSEVGFHAKRNPELRRHRLVTGIGLEQGSSPLRK